MNTDEVIKSNSNDNSFSVYTYSIINLNDSRQWVHWSKGLKMMINKNGTTIYLEEDEIEELVKSLPRTFGGSY